jgi:phospholipase C
MSKHYRKSRFLHGCGIALSALAMGQFCVGSSFAQVAPTPADGQTRTPIKHVIVIIGENRSFDHVFATYVPKRPGVTVQNLLSEGIVMLDGNKDAVQGPNFEKAHQLAANDLGSTDPFLLDPPKQPFPKDHLPTPLVGGPVTSVFKNQCDNDTPITACKQNLELAIATESGLDPSYYPLLLSGGTGQTTNTPDQRLNNVGSLPAGPFQLTNGNTFTYDSYAASPVHRFYQMWQQLNCSKASISHDNPSGCTGNLFAWVEATVGPGSNGTTTSAAEGATALGFYNVQKGDVPYFTNLADTYAMSDNFHQSVAGGTGVNHVMFGHADMIWFSDADGNPAAPPNGVQVFSGGPDAGTVHEVEDPSPAPGTNNWYTQDGYGPYGNSGLPPPYSVNPYYGGGSYSNCSDPNQPGVKAILDYLRSLRRPIDPRCEPGHYYLLNNYNPGWFGNGKNAYTDTNPANTPFTIPPSSVRSIGDSLTAKNIRWKYYGDQWDNYVKDPYGLNFNTPGDVANKYCNICNPFQYDTSIMSDPDQRAAHINDSKQLYADIANYDLPAVSIVKPSGYVDGHPATSKLNLFEGFVKKIVDQVQASNYANDTAIFITFDEGGGYYDSGYVQPLDFFGDGTRIPLIVVSRFAKHAYISHDYADHVSIIKFIERNWNVPRITDRSRDNFPNPVADPGNPYVPQNSPAISDLFDLFEF